MAAAAVAFGGAARVFHFVEAVGVEADGKGVDRRAARGGEGADDGRAVGAAGQKRCGGRRIGIAHRLIQHAAEIAAMGVEAGIDRGVVGLPVKAGAELAVFQGEGLPRQQLVHALIEAARRGNGVEIEIVVDRLRVDDAADGGVGRHALHAAAEHQLVAVLGVTQALGADAVERQKGFFLQRFEHGEGEIALHQRGQYFAEADPAVRHRHGRILVAGDEGQIGVEKARSSVQGRGQPVLDVDIGLAEARAAGHPEHLAAVRVQRAFRRQACRLPHMLDQVLMRAVVAQPAKNAIHGVVCQSDAG